MDYQHFFSGSIDELKAEGRYRVFADLERQVGNFPRATYHGPTGQRTVTVWCSNDYLGMGQHPVVRAAMHEAVDRVGTGARRPRNIPPTSHIQLHLAHTLPPFPAPPPPLSS